jgi:hypothetical protein
MAVIDLPERERLLLGNLGEQRQRGQPHQEPVWRRALAEPEHRGESVALRNTAHWRAWLERLAGDFAAGRAEVDPKLAAGTCRYCHLAALCRVEPASLDEAEVEAADGD